MPDLRFIGDFFGALSDIVYIALVIVLALGSFMILVSCLYSVSLWKAVLGVAMAAAVYPLVLPFFDSVEDRRTLQDADDACSQSDRGFKVVDEVPHQIPRVLRVATPLDREEFDWVESPAGFIAGAPTASPFIRLSKVKGLQALEYTSSVAGGIEYVRKGLDDHGTASLLASNAGEIIRVASPEGSLALISRSLSMKANPQIKGEQHLLVDEKRKAVIAYAVRYGVKLENHYRFTLQGLSLKGMTIDCQRFPQSQGELWTYGFLKELFPEIDKGAIR